MAGRNEQDPGFKVIDRRGLADEKAPPAATKPEAPETSVPESAPGPAPAESLDFTTFVLSLGSSAAIHLGDLPHPEDGERKRDLPQAKQFIDLLGLLRDKTQGNLTDDEARFLDGLLYDLRLRFVEASREG